MNLHTYPRPSPHPFQHETLETFPEVHETHQSFFVIQMGTHKGQKVKEIRINKVVPFNAVRYKVPVGLITPEI